MKIVGNLKEDTASYMNVIRLVECDEGVYCMTVEDRVMNRYIMIYDSVNRDKRVVYEDNVVDMVYRPPSSLVIASYDNKLKKFALSDPIPYSPSFPPNSPDSEKTQKDPSASKTTPPPSYKHLSPHNNTISKSLVYEEEVEGRFSNRSKIIHTNNNRDMVYFIQDSIGMTVRGISTGVGCSKQVMYHMNHMNIDRMIVLNNDIYTLTRGEGYFTKLCVVKRKVLRVVRVKGIINDIYRDMGGIVTEKGERRIIIVGNNPIGTTHLMVYDGNLECVKKVFMNSFHFPIYSFSIHFDGDLVKVMKMNDKNNGVEIFDIRDIQDGSTNGVIVRPFDCVLFPEQFNTIILYSLAQCYVIYRY